MAGSIEVGGVHHVVLTVSDVARARDFYRDLFGFQEVAEIGARLLMSNGVLLLGLGLSPDPEQAVSGDRFNENRVGLDHLSFGVTSREDLVKAARILDERGVPHGEIKDLEPFNLSVLAFRDPDNVQLELSAPIR